MAISNRLSGQTVMTEDEHPEVPAADPTMEALVRIEGSMKLILAAETENNKLLKECLISIGNSTEESQAGTEKRLTATPPSMQKIEHRLKWQSDAIKCIKEMLENKEQSFPTTENAPPQSSEAKEWAASVANSFDLYAERILNQRISSVVKRFDPLVKSGKRWIRALAICCGAMAVLLVMLLLKI